MTGGSFVFVCKNKTLTLLSYSFPYFISHRPLPLSLSFPPKFKSPNFHSCIHFLLAKPPFNTLTLNNTINHQCQYVCHHVQHLHLHMSFFLFYFIFVFGFGWIESRYRVKRILFVSLVSIMNHV